MMIPKARRLVVVVGCQRSGTTLTGQLLGAHSGAVLRSLPFEVKLVFRVRDPRAVVASMLRLSRIDFPANQARLLRDRPAVAARFEAELEVLSDPSRPRWERYATVWRVKTGFAADFEADGAHVFRYEDLVQDPRSRLRALQAHCALAHEDLLQAADGSRAAAVTRQVEGDLTLTAAHLAPRQLQ